MERKGPDLPDFKPGFENPEVDPSEQHSLSGEKWQNIFRNLYRRTDAAPESKDHIEQEYELRHEHKDVPATTGHHLGAVVAGTLGDNRTSTAPDGPPADGASKPTRQQTSDTGGLPDYHEPSAGGSRTILSWIIVVVLLVAIIALLSLLF